MKRMTGRSAWEPDRGRPDGSAPRLATRGKAQVSRVERGLYDLMVRAYPQEFRGEYGAEMREHFALLRGGAGSVTGRVRVWLELIVDTARSAPRERWQALRDRRRDGGTRSRVEADAAGALLAGCAVLLLYCITLAPTTGFWDAGEYITVAKVLGIPHPPGNPLFVLLARCWDWLLGPTGWPTALRINLLSAVLSAAAHALLFLLLERSLRGSGWTRGVRRVAAACGVLLSATAFTVWHQSNVNEKVYTVSFCTVMLCAWLAVRWRDTRRPALLVLAAYVTALSMANHMMGALVAPALLVFVFMVERRVLFSPRVLATTLPLLALALSAHFVLPLRARQQPLVNEGDPQCTSATAAAVSVFTLGAKGCEALAHSLRREQYQKASIRHDPTVPINEPARPRTAGLLAAQFVNYAQYLDWQWARPVAGRAPLFGWPRPLITLALLLLVLLGARAQWRADRAAAVLHGVLLLTLSVGLVLYLNFKYGYTIASETMPARDLHEVRERDYFFFIGFSLFGAWAGVGLGAVWQLVAQQVRHVARHPQLAAAPVLGLALVPLALNWSWASRADDWTARDWAYNVLMSVEPYGVLVTNGDNDSFPLWYLQHVERVREDVTIVLAPYLDTAWYARQIRDLSRPCAPGTAPEDDASRIVCQRRFRREQVHPKLLAAWHRAERLPEDSILPLADADIDRIARTFFITPEPIQRRVGAFHATIAAGTLITPADTFVAALLDHAYGKRPLHFMSPSPILQRFGLLAHTVRVGLTWRLRVPEDDQRVVAVADPQLRVNTGAFIDLEATDTLSRHIFIVRGRVSDPDSMWVDHATFDIPMQYALMHYAAARAYEALADRAGFDHHAERLEFWNRIVAE